MEKVCFGLITGAVKPAANISPEKAGIEQNEKRKPKLTLSLLQKEKSHNEFLRYSHTTFDNYQSKQIPKQEGRPITLKGGFLN